MASSEAQRRATKKYDAKTYAKITCKAKIADIEKCKAYAGSVNLSPSKFGTLAMLYCIENNIDPKPKNDAESE